MDFQIALQLAEQNGDVALKTQIEETFQYLEKRIVPDETLRYVINGELK